jgi:ribonuclease PH
MLAGVPAMAKPISRKRRAKLLYRRRQHPIMPENPNLESRNPKQIRNRETFKTERRLRRNVESISAFGFFTLFRHSSFGFRISEILLILSGISRVRGLHPCAGFDGLSNPPMPSASSLRTDGRRADQLRQVTFEANIAPYASGSVLVSFGLTRVICAATIEPKVPTWMRQQGIPGGWLTAEYSMLPYSTLERKQRDISKGKIDGRTVEIQRLIGRSLRAVVDLKKLGDNTLWVDCDVLQADGGTRTASITGAYLAARLAVQKLIDAKRIADNPIADSVAAVSVGLHAGRELLDLAYVEDRDAEVDFNVVMTGRGQYVEVQGTGEESTFTHEQLQSLLVLAQKGLKELASLQTAFLTRQLLAR